MSITVIILIIIFLVLAYNNLVTLKNRVKEAWADIEVQLKRRYDLIPNLVETVKGYATHEREVFEKVTEARTRAMGAQSMSEKAAAEDFLGNTLKSLFAVSENYPQLRATENFQQLQRDLTDTEDKIQAARRFYNTNVRDYNTALQSFPLNIVAGAFNFKNEFDFFETKNPEEREAVKVKF